MKVMCRTLFDCTHTGVTGHFRPQQLPYTTKSGIKLETPEHWNLARNQQRNWETLTQILSLRTQLFEITDPIPDQTGTRWMFEFETEAEALALANAANYGLAATVWTQDIS